MERKLLLTRDGSTTIEVVGSGDTYHSRHGAIQESRHVFLTAGLDYFYHSYPDRHSIRIFEAGFGTGLNALLTAQYAAEHKLQINYSSVEAYPLSIEEYSGLNYGAELKEESLFLQLHSAPWNAHIKLSPYFTINKLHTTLQEATLPDKVDVIYFDAFAPGSQPELWTTEIFSNMNTLLADNGILVTYCSKVIVQKAMKAAGFWIEKLQGPPGKREIIRAFS